MRGCQTSEGWDRLCAVRQDCVNKNRTPSARSKLTDDREAVGKTLNPENLYRPDTQG